MGARFRFSPDGDRLAFYGSTLAGTMREATIEVVALATASTGSNPDGGS